MASDLRALMKAKKATKKAPPKLAKWLDNGELRCLVCGAHVRSENLWPGHLKSREHVKAVLELQRKKAEREVVEEARKSQQEADRRVEKRRMEEVEARSRASGAAASSSAGSSSLGQNENQASQASGRASRERSGSRERGRDRSRSRSGSRNRSQGRRSEGRDARGGEDATANGNAAGKKPKSRIQMTIKKKDNNANAPQAPNNQANGSINGTANGTAGGMSDDEESEHEAKAAQIRDMIVNRLRRNQNQKDLEKKMRAEYDKLENGDNDGDDGGNNMDVDLDPNRSEPASSSSSSSSRNPNSSSGKSLGSLLDERKKRKMGGNNENTDIDHLLNPFGTAGSADAVGPQLVDKFDLEDQTIAELEAQEKVAIDKFAKPANNNVPEGFFDNEDDEADAMGIVGPSRLKAMEAEKEKIRREVEEERRYRERMDVESRIARNRYEGIQEEEEEKREKLRVEIQNLKKKKDEEKRKEEEKKRKEKEERNKKKVGKTAGGESESDSSSDEEFELDWRCG